MNPPTPTSIPPAAKVAAAKGKVWAQVIAQLTELTALICATILVAMGLFDRDDWKMVFAAVILGPLYDHVRGHRRNGS